MTQRKLEVPLTELGGHRLDVPAETIREQLDRILANPLFAHSKRYPLLFRYVVERALEGHAGQLKERTLGIEVFSRLADYDTNLDPVVRVTAGEIRKRIAQYYHEPGHDGEWRIDLPTGSYVPEFHPPAHQEPVAAAVPAASRPAPWWKPLWVAAAALVLALPVAALWRWSGDSVDRFWAPVWDRKNDATLCIGGAGIAKPAEVAPADLNVSVTEQIHRQYVSFADTTAFTRLAGLFETRGKGFAMRLSTDTTFADLRDRPVVLVGGFNNAWTMRLLSKLRFSLARDADRDMEWIADRQNPLRRDWIVECGVPNWKLNEDYAIVARLLDPATEQMVVIAAGIVQYGTVAAGEFLTNPAYLNELVKKAPANWQRQNVQAVIATNVINGHSGPPRLLAAHFW